MAEHIFRYNTHAEKRYFLGEMRELYDIIAINGNIVSHTPGAIASFLATANKPFFIDPQTHAFQHPTGFLKRSVEDEEGTMTEEFKPSVIKLANERLGNPFSSVIVNDSPLKPGVFYSDNGNINADLINVICEKVIFFQTGMLYGELDEEERELIGSPDLFLPCFIMAPYFYLDARNYKEWFDINIACYLRTKELYTALPVYLPFVVSQEVLKDVGPAELLEGSKLSGVKDIDGIIIWIDDFEEESLSISDIQSWGISISTLRSYTEKIFNIYGGYLSILFAHEGAPFHLFDGVGHCINYGESRPVVPVGGGIPLARFYFPSVHSRLKYDNALSIVRRAGWLKSREIYFEKVCRCAECLRLVNDSDSIDEAFFTYGRANEVSFTRGRSSFVRLDYPTAEAKQAAALHYLYNKYREFRDIESKPFDLLVEEMITAFNEISPVSGDDLVSHLWTWPKAIEKIPR